MVRTVCSEPLATDAAKAMRGQGNAARIVLTSRRFRLRLGGAGAADTRARAACVCVCVFRRPGGRGRAGEQGRARWGGGRRAGCVCVWGDGADLLALETAPA